MRDYMRVVVVIFVTVIAIIALAVFAPGSILPIGFLLAAGMCGLLALWVNRLIQERNSPQLCALGFWTSLNDIEPVKTADIDVMVKEVDPKDASKTISVPKKFTFELYRHRGCKPSGVPGGGSSGYSWVRRDLREIIPGDRTQIWVHSAPPRIFLEHAPIESEYKPLAALEKKLRDAVMQLPDYVESAHIFVYYDPPKVDSRKALSDQKYPFDELYFQLQSEMFEGCKSHDRSMKSSAELADIMKKIIEGHKNDLDGGIPGQ